MLHRTQRNIPQGFVEQQNNQINRTFSSAPAYAQLAVAVPIWLGLDGVAQNMEMVLPWAVNIRIKTTNLDGTTKEIGTDKEMKSIKWFSGTFPAVREK